MATMPGPWQRRTNIWRRATNPARGPKRLRSGTAKRVSRAASSRRQGNLERNMKTLIPLLVALVASVNVAKASELPANAEFGCRMVNDLMRPSMLREDDAEFFDCNRKQIGNNGLPYHHMQSVGKCMEYVVMEWTTLNGRRFDIRNVPPKAYMIIQQGCAMLVLNISQAEYDARCTSFCPRPRPN